MSEIQTRDVDMRVAIYETSYSDSSYDYLPDLYPSIDSLLTESRTSNTYFGDKYDYVINSTNGKYRITKTVTAEGTHLVEITAKTLEVITKIKFPSRTKSKNIYFLNTSNLTNIDEMFYGNVYLEYINCTPDGSNWDLSNITSMRKAFYECNDLITIEGAENWDLRKVTDMYQAFYECRDLTGLNTSTWHLDSVEDMTETFYYCDNLTELDTRYWSLQNLKNFYKTFKKCRDITEIDGRLWSLSNVVNLGQTFSECANLKLIRGVENWDIGNVENLDATFDGTAIEELDLSRWDTKNAIILCPFTNCEQLKTVGDITGWDVSKVEDMFDFMWCCDSMEEIDVTGWDVRKVKSLCCAFCNCANLKRIIGLDTWSLESVEDVSECFAFNRSLEYIDISTWHLPKATEVCQLFLFSEGLKTVNVCNLTESPDVTDIHGVFNGCHQLEYIYGLDKWNMEQVEDISEMFCNCVRLKNLDDIKKWNTSNVTDFYSVFDNCYSIGTIDISNWDLSSADNVAYMFGMEEHWGEWCDGNCFDFTDENLTAITVDLSTLNLSNIKLDSRSMFSAEEGYELINNIIVRNTSVSSLNKVIEHLYDRNNNTSGSIHVDGVTNLVFANYVPAVEKNWKFYIENEEVDFDLLVPENVIKIADYKSSQRVNNSIECYEDLDWEIPIEVLVTYSVEEQAGSVYTEILPHVIYIYDAYMTEISNIKFVENEESCICFETMEELTDIHGTENWDVSKMTNMDFMFYECYKLANLNLTNWDTSNVTTMKSMFEECKSLSSESMKTIEKLKMNNVTNIYGMFEYCENLDLDLTNWDTSNVIDMGCMFYRCKNSRINMRNLNTVNVEKMNDLFSGATNITVDLYGIKMDNLTTLESAFYNSQINGVLDFSNTVLSSNVPCKINENIFYNCNVDTIKFFKSYAPKGEVRLFDHCLAYNLTGLSGLDLSEATSLNRMFTNCTNLQNLDASNWNTTNITKIGYFTEESALKTINISNWDLSNLSDTYRHTAFRDGLYLEELIIGNMNKTTLNYVVGGLLTRTADAPGTIYHTLSNDELAEMQTIVDTAKSKHWNFVHREDLPADAIKLVIMLNNRTVPLYYKGKKTL